MTLRFLLTGHYVWWNVKFGRNEYFFSHTGITWCCISVCKIFSSDILSGKVLISSDITVFTLHVGMSDGNVIVCKSLVNQPVLLRAIFLVGSFNVYMKFLWVPNIDSCSKMFDLMGPRTQKMQNLHLSTSLINFHYIVTRTCNVSNTSPRFCTLLE